MKSRHNICWQCWKKKHTDAEKDDIRRPVRVVNFPEETLEARCCFCGHENLEGIYVYEKAENVPCKCNH